MSLVLTFDSLPWHRNSTQKEVGDEVVPIQYFVQMDEFRPTIETQEVLVYDMLYKTYDFETKINQYLQFFY